VTVWSTAPPADFLALGDYAQVGYGDAGTFSNWERPYGPPLAVRELNASEGLLAAPIGWTKLYTASASSPFTLWRPSARAGYVSLGDVGTVDGKEPPAGKYTTVHESCVVSCPADVMLWGDKDGRVALYGARGDDGARAVSTGGLLADVVSYPTGALVAQQMALCLKPSCLSDSDDVPEQLHIALGYTPDTMAVQWAAAVGGGASTLCSRGKAVAVHYGFKGGALSRSAVADCTPFNLGSGQLSQENWNASTSRPLIATLIHMHTRHAHAQAPARAYTTRSPMPWHLTCPHPAAALRGLAASTEYSYQVVSGDASSALLSFRTAPDASTLTAQLPHQFVIYGDLGHKVPTGSSTVMPYVTRDVRDGPPGLPRSVIDMVLHVGDLACEIPIWPFGPLPAASSLVLRAAHPTLLRSHSHALRPRLGPTLIRRL
jgi:hypothetical protein